MEPIIEEEKTPNKQSNIKEKVTLMRNSTVAVRSFRKQRLRIESEEVQPFQEASQR